MVLISPKSVCFKILFIAYDGFREVNVKREERMRKGKSTYRNWRGIPGWRSGLAPAFGPGRDPGDLGWNPTSGSRCMEPASPSACVSASLSLSLSLSHCVPIINKKKKKERKKKKLERELSMWNESWVD